MRFMKYALAGLALAGGGAGLGAVLAGAGFLALWWSFPSAWQPLAGVPDAPQALLAVDAQPQTFLLRTASGQLFTCHAQACLPADSDWSSPDTRCDDTTRPASTALFPLVVSGTFREVLACEGAYLDTVWTIYVARAADGQLWQNAGSGLIPADAAVVGAAAAGGAVGLLAGLLAAGGLGMIALWRRRAPRYNTGMIALHPLTLTGPGVRLEPLTEAHVPELAAAGDDERIWRFTVYGQVRGAAAMRAWVQARLASQAAGTDLPFAVIHRATGRAIGATRFMEIEPRHRRVEIGGTWYAVDYQRTAVNTECKYLLLRHAFEVWECVRVQFKTDLRNERSQRAIERLGAVREGVLRNHMILPDGTQRHSVYYSILPAEWPAVKAQLEARLVPAG